jgi:hypothetical protein
VFGGDPRPGVLYLEGNFVAAGLGLHHDPSPIRRMPEGVGKQIAQDLDDPVDIRQYRR